MEISVTVNGKTQRHDVEPRLLLVHYLRDQLNLTGAHVGCDTSQCGACVIHLDGQAVKSCTTLAVQADGHDVTTIEGLRKDGEYTPMQQGFWEMHGLQCGFCTPGMIMSASALLNANAHPSDDEIRHALEGNLCRCTGYENIVRAVRYAAEHTNGSTGNGASADLRDQSKPGVAETEAELEHPERDQSPPEQPETVEDWKGENAGESDA